MNTGVAARSEAGFASGAVALGLADQLLVLRRRWRIILATIGLTVCLTCLALAVLPIRYTATGVLLYDPAPAAPLGDAAPAVDPADLDAATASQSAIITSLPQDDALAAELGLARDPEFNAALRPRLWPWDLAMPPAAPAAAAVAAAVHRALGAAMLPDSRITVSFTSADPVLAAAASNCWVRPQGGVAS